MRSNAAAHRWLSLERQVPGNNPAELPMKEGERCFLQSRPFWRFFGWCCFFAVHITSFAIHIILILAVISLIAHLFTGRKA